MIRYLPHLISIAAIVGTVANIYKMRVCFLIWLFTNLAWCIINIGQARGWWRLKQSNYAQAWLYLAYAGLAVMGMIKWARP